LFIQRCLVTLFPIGLNSFSIVVGTDRKENTAALLLPSLQALQFQYIILILYNLDDYSRLATAVFFGSTIPAFVPHATIFKQGGALLCRCLATAISSGSTIPAFSPHVTVFLNKEVPYRSRFLRFGLEYASRKVQGNKETDTGSHQFLENMNVTKKKNNRSSIRRVGGGWFRSKCREN
jgi:hypothetical protein